MKYFKPKSLSWWSAIAYGGLSIARGIGVEVPSVVDGLIAAVFGIGMRGRLGKK